MIQTEKKNLSQLKLKIIWFFLKPYKLHVVALFILASIIGVLESIQIAAIYPMVSLGMDIKPGQDNILFSLIGKIALTLPIKDAFISYCILFLLLTVVIFIVTLFNVYLTVSTTSAIVMKNKERIFEKLMKADYQYFLDQKQGGLIYTATIAPDSVMGLMTSVTKLLSGIISMLFIFILLFSISWQGTTLVMLVGVGYYFATQYLGTNVLYTAGVGRVEAGTKEHVILNEVFDGIKQIKIFLTQSEWVKKFESAVGQYYYHYRKSTVWKQFPSLGITLLAFSAIGIMGLILRIQNPGDFVPLLPLFGTFAFALLRLLGPLSNFGVLRMNIMTSLPDSEIVYSTLNKQFEDIKDGKKELRSFTSNIQLDNVSFAHKGRSGTIKDISITFEKSKTTAIVGPSGVGKTTIVDLLVRLFDPDKGEVKIDGVNLKEYKLSSWLSKIGVVTQDTFIFHDSVKNNIIFGSDGHSDEEIIQAAKSADAHGFILEFPEGYDTIVGERGMKLSGGQKQRIAIARAIIKKPEILILDEATSALDNKSEALVQEAIEKVSKNRTVIVVAHRLSTIINADKIVVLKDGRVLEEGTHEELMERRGVYWNLYKTQESV
jgi:ABC-type multidrug transport system fused ATPase/permease subunit